MLHEHFEYQNAANTVEMVASSSKPLQITRNMNKTLEVKKETQNNSGPFWLWLWLLWLLWLLVVGCWLLVSGCWLLLIVAGCSCCCCWSFLSFLSFLSSVSLVLTVSITCHYWCSWHRCCCCCCFVGRTATALTVTVQLDLDLHFLENPKHPNKL